MAVEFRASFTHNLRNLATISGRDRLGLYWPYTLVVYGISLIIGFAMTIPIMVGAMTEGFDAVRQAAAGGGEVDQAAMQAQMMATMTADLGRMLPVQIGTSVVLVILLTAATIRRLHDRNWSGWWVMPVLLGQLLGIVGSAYYHHRAAIDPTVLDPGNPVGLALQGANLVLLVAFVVILVQLVQRGSEADNRFGPPQD